jgi:hypothetical protein
MASTVRVRISTRMIRSVALSNLGDTSCDTDDVIALVYVISFCTWRYIAASQKVFFDTTYSTCVRVIKSHVIHTTKEVRSTLIS